LKEEIDEQHVNIRSSEKCTENLNVKKTREEFHKKMIAIDGKQLTV
jgi:hypothetical protein